MDWFSKGLFLAFVLQIQIGSTRADCIENLGQVSKVQPILPFENPPKRMPNWDLVKRAAGDTRRKPGASERAPDRVEISEAAKFANETYKLAVGKLTDLGLSAVPFPSPSEIGKAYAEKMKESADFYASASGMTAAEDRHDEILNQGRYRDALKFFIENGYIAEEQIPRLPY